MSQYYSAGCGCAPVPQSGCASPVYPVQGAIIADNRYFSLGVSPNGQMLVVPKGSNMQAFLRATPGFRGFVFYQDEIVQATATPELTLPLLNPAVSGVYPVPGGFKYLTAATGPDPAGWRHVAAPSTGSYVLQVINGSWVLSDAGQIPGINQVLTGGYFQKGDLLAIVETAPGVATVKKLAVQHGRVVVGDVDGVGVAGYKPLSPSAALVHPIGKFQDLRLGTLTSLDGSGNEIAGGLEQAVVTGVGAVTDGLRMIYSPTTKRLYRAPAQTLNYLQVNVSASATPPVAYAALPGGHGAGTPLNFNYPIVEINFSIFFNSDEVFTLGLFRNGVLLNEYLNSATVDTFTICYVDSAAPLGTNTYDWRWKKAVGTNAASCRFSAFNIKTLGY